MRTKIIYRLMAFVAGLVVIAAVACSTEEGSEQVSSDSTGQVPASNDVEPGQQSAQVPVSSLPPITSADGIAPDQ